MAKRSPAGRESPVLTKSHAARYLRPLVAAIALCASLWFVSTVDVALAAPADVFGSPQEATPTMHSQEPEDALAVSSQEQEEISTPTMGLERFSVTSPDANEVDILVRGGLTLRSAETAFDYYSLFTDEAFLQPATQYNHQLATMSVCMATSANRPIPYDSNVVVEPDQYLVRYLDDAGFENVREDDYDKTPSLYTVATAMGSKIVYDEDGEPFTLLAVGVCGGNYKKEWMSNMTLGDGVRHAGFDAAARMVTDRIFGYLGSNHITGRVKVWIAGFSRAAAVSNVTAANLVDSGMFAQEDIFAYTFATPRTTREAGEQGYENIFNIMGAMDMIPQVSPAYWGFGRYGRDLFLPGQEFDSGFAQKYALIKEGFARDYESATEYDPGTNMRLRMAIGMFGELIKSQDDYDQSAQDNIRSLLEDKSPQNVLRVLRAIMLPTKDDAPEQRLIEDQMIEFLGRFAIDLVRESGATGSFSNVMSAATNVFHEHFEDSYISWMHADLTPEQLYDRPSSFTYIMAFWCPALIIEDSATGEELCRVAPDGTATYTAEGQARGLDFAIENVEMEDVIAGANVIALPQDADYRVRWEADDSADVEFVTALVLPCQQAIQTSYDGYFGFWDTSVVDGGVLYEAHGTQIERPPDLEPTEIQSSTMSDALGMSYVRNGWRVAIMQNLLRVSLVCVLLRAVVALINRWGSAERWEWRFVMSSLTMIALVESEAAYWLFGGSPVIRLGWIGVASCAVLLYCVACRNANSERFWWLLAAIFALLASGVAVNFWFDPGMWLYACAQLFLAVLFLRDRGVRKAWLAWWAMLSVVLCALMLRGAGRLSPVVSYGVAACCATMLLLLTAARRQGGNLWLGSWLLALSDVMAGYYLFVDGMPYVHMAHMALFYLALLVMCRSLVDEEVVVVPDGSLVRRFNLTDALVGLLSRLRQTAPA